MPKTKIELDDEQARKFELFYLIETITGGQDWKWKKAQYLPEGRIVIHLQTKKVLDKK